MSKFIDPREEMPNEFQVVEITGSCTAGSWLCTAQAVLVKNGEMNSFRNKAGQKWKFVKNVNGELQAYKARDVEGWRYL